MRLAAFSFALLVMLAPGELLEPTGAPVVVRETTERAATEVAGYGNLRSGASLLAVPGATQGEAGSVEPFGYDVHVPAGVDPKASLPMVIALHGRGSSAKRIRRQLGAMRLPVRWVLPRGPLPATSGNAWFSKRVRTRHQDVLADEIESAADRLAATVRLALEEQPTIGRPVVLGFSQGGVLAWSLAMHHSELVNLAVPIAGFLPESLREYESATEHRPRVVAFHGRKDRTIRLAAGRATADRSARQGVLTSFRAYPTGHQISPKMRRDLRRLLREQLAAAGT